MPNMAQEQRLGTKRGKSEMARAARRHSAQDSSRPKPEEVVGRLTLFGYEMHSAPCPEYERKLGTSDAQGYGGMIRQEISANRAEYNRGCR
jgi:hypothetical protein